MKKIKQYFANGTKDVDVEAAADPSTAVKQEEEQEETIAMGKRKRVKIRISRNTSKQRICDVIENKNDLIDKTPSPLNIKVNNDKSVSQDGTPKSYLAGLKRCPKKGSKLTVEVNTENSQSKKMKNILQDKTESNEQFIVDLNDSSTDNIKTVNDESLSNIELCDEIGSQREESNAFQVLMNRSKPIQYKVLPQQSTEDIKCKQKLDEAKELKSKCKEKLITLADKKGYSKKKILEMEEGERIEKNIEDRMRFFKNNSKSDITNERNDIGLSIKNKQSSGNLLNYFSSKSHLNVTNKDEKCLSTFIVKADVHRTDNSEIEPAIKSIPDKMYCNKKCSKSKLDLSTVDDIHIVASENLFSPQIVKQDKQKREKPWSLRIKLRPSENNDSSNDTTEEELFSPRSKSKFHVSNKSRMNAEENNRVDIKDHNGHIKAKERNKEKKELNYKQKGSNALNSTKNVIVNDNNKDIDLCPKESKKTNKREQVSDKSEEVVTIIDECTVVSENILKRKPNEKLAPLFTKRRKTDPTVIAARRSFLQSDITDMESKNTDRKINNNIAVLLFPTISHVTQLEDKSDLIKVEIKHKYQMKPERRYLPSIDINNYKYITNYREASKTSEMINEPVKENIDMVLSEIEKLCPDVREMWKALTIKCDQKRDMESLDDQKRSKEKRSPPRMRGRKAKLLERKKKAENFENKEDLSHDCAWTCKYKPKSVQEIVGNEEAVDKLKSWLSGWRASLTKEDDGSSGDEFYSSDCSSMCNNENNQIAVLLGPHGSGKSASVYAIAEELGYSVLEVNASSKRTGKIILKELEEATKSHRIKKKKHTFPFEQKNESEIPKILQNSLILLEDIDLIFEEDEGFISAAYQLASNTKRPIVMTCRDICPHLNKMAPQQNKIYFQQVNFVNGSRASVLLELISLAEKGYRLPHNCLMELLQTGDLRQALLQLQYLLLSGSPILSEQSTIMKPLWQDMRSYLYKPAIKLSRKHKAKKSTNTKKTNTACVLNDLAEKLDGLSLVSCLIDIKDSALNVTEKNTQPNLSLAENISFYSASRDLNVKIASFIIDQILYKDSSVNEIVQNQTNLIVKKQLNEGVDLALSHVASSCLDRQIMALDYLPAARTICRAEESRSTANWKRGNRFFHYLHSLQVPMLLMKPNILTAACGMLQEKINKNASTSGVTSN